MATPTWFEPLAAPTARGCVPRTRASSPYVRVSPGGDRPQRFPDPALERRAVHLDQHVVERAEVAREVCAQALADGVARADARERRVESGAAERIAREGEMERADGSVDGIDARHGLLLHDNQMAAAAYARQGRQRSARSRSARGASSRA